jgi:hypothetical protein
MMNVWRLVPIGGCVEIPVTPPTTIRIAAMKSGMCLLWQLSPLLDAGVHLEKLYDRTVWLA